MTDNTEPTELTEVTGATGQSEPAAAAGSPGRASVRKTREGMVVSDKMDKTVVVAVEDRVKHAVYSKVIRRTSRLKAHDESNEVGIGDRVLIMETRPLSATKRWRVVQVIEKAQ
jgi:small subunit ribosomal protein S17